jgi:DNA-binding transcriptional MerR regulator
MFRIGEFSRLSQVSIKALRFYDELGLLKPTFVDRATGYRYYSPDLLPCLNRILALKGLGFSLDEIALLLKERLPVDLVCQALHDKRDDLARRITQEQARLSQVEAWLTQIEQGDGSPNYDVVSRQVAPQLVASVRDTLSSYDEAAELFVELERHLKENNSNGCHAAVWHACTGQGVSIECEAVMFLNRLSHRRLGFAVAARDEKQLHQRREPSGQHSGRGEKARPRRIPDRS